MKLYIISKTDMTLKDVLIIESMNIETDIEYKCKSKVTVAREPTYADEDYANIIDDGGVVYSGIIDEVSNADGNNSYTLSLLQIQRLFDRKIILGDDTLLTTGIEDFIASEITTNWIENTDTALNLSYLTVTADTHTPVSASVDTDHGIFNLKTYIGNAMELYGVFLIPEFATGELNLSVRKIIQNQLIIDARVTDVTDYNEALSVDALGKLSVIWNNAGTETTINKYLQTDRTITDDPESVTRAHGRIDVIYIESTSEDDVNARIANEFKRNSYKHSIEMRIRNESKLFPRSEIYTGHNVTVVTKSGAQKSSIITSVSFDESQTFVSVKLGKLPVTLIEKLREVLT